MNGIYYKQPLNFKKLIDKKDLEKTNLDQSIAQYCNLIITSSFGECKFDENFGCGIWEIDFNLLTNLNILKDKLAKDILASITQYEKRITMIEVIVEIGELGSPAYKTSTRLKKRINLFINATVVQTRRPFNFHGNFFIGPFSYT